MSLTFAFLTSFLLSGCGTTTDGQVPTEAETSIAAAGQRFDPPVASSELPVGAWICDMGTVHYASGDKNDGKCPVCGMNLTEKK